MQTYSAPVNLCYCCSIKYVDDVFLRGRKHFEAVVNSILRMISTQIIGKAQMQLKLKETQNAIVANDY